MRFTLVIDKERDEEVVVYAHKITGLVNEIEQIVSRNSLELIGYNERSCVKLSPADVCCFTVEDNKVYAITQTEKLLVKYRLYQLEESLPESFVKINQSCIVNISQIKKFDASISGTLKVTLVNGYNDYVSRRQLKNVKERLSL